MPTSWAFVVPIELIRDDVFNHLQTCLALTLTLNLTLTLILILTLTLALTRRWTRLSGLALWLLWPYLSQNKVCAFDCMSLRRRVSHLALVSRINEKRVEQSLGGRSPLIAAKVNERQNSVNSDEAAARMDGSSSVEDSSYDDFEFDYRYPMATQSRGQSNFTHNEYPQNEHAIVEKEAKRLTRLSQQTWKNGGKKRKADEIDRLSTTNEHQTQETINAWLNSLNFTDIGMGGFVPGTKNLVSSVSDCFRNQWAVLEAQGKVEVDYSISANRPEAQLGPVEIHPLKSIASELPLSAITPPESVKWAFGGNETVLDSNNDDGYYPAIAEISSNSQTGGGVSWLYKSDENVTTGEEVQLKETVFNESSLFNAAPELNCSHYSLAGCKRWEQTTIADDWLHKSVDTTINSFTDGCGVRVIEPFGWDIVAPMGVKSSPPRKRHRNIFAGNAKDRLYALRLLVESSDARYETQFSSSSTGLPGSTPPSSYLPAFDRHPLWGWAIDAHWIWRSGRLSSQSRLLSSNLTCSEEGNWWSRVHLLLTVAPLVAKHQAESQLLNGCRRKNQIGNQWGVVVGDKELRRPELEVVMETMRHMWEMDNEAAKDETFLHLLSRGQPLHQVHEEALRRPFWEAKAKILRYAISIYSSELDQLPPMEKILAIGWVRHQQILAALVAPCGACDFMKFSKGLLQEEPFLNGYDPHNKASLSSIGGLRQLGSFSEKIWNRWLKLIKRASKSDPGRSWCRLLLSSPSKLETVSSRLSIRVVLSVIAATIPSINYRLLTPPFGLDPAKDVTECSWASDNEQHDDVELMWYKLTKYSAESRATVPVHPYHRDRPRISAEGMMEYDAMLMPPLPEWDGDPRPQEGTSFIEEGLLPQRKSAAAVFEIASEETSFFHEC
eukprot:516972_1